MCDLCDETTSAAAGDQIRDQARSLQSLAHRLYELGSGRLKPHSPAMEELARDARTAVRVLAEYI